MASAPCAVALRSRRAARATIGRIRRPSLTTTTGFSRWHCATTMAAVRPMAAPSSTDDAAKLHHDQFHFMLPFVRHALWPEYSKRARRRCRLNFPRLPASRRSKSWLQPRQRLVLCETASFQSTRCTGAAVTVPSFPLPRFCSPGTVAVDRSAPSTRSAAPAQTAIPARQAAETPATRQEYLRA